MNYLISLNEKWIGFLHLFKFCSLLHVQVEIVDMHYGLHYDPLKDSTQFANHLQEISMYQQVSRGCYFLVSTNLRYS